MLLKHGKCPHGDKKVTLGKQGPKGAKGSKGPQGDKGQPGPAATYQTQSTPDDDSNGTFDDANGLRLATFCSVGEVELGLGTGPTGYDVSGTSSADGAVSAVDKTDADDELVQGAHNADLDVVANADGGVFEHLDFHGTFSSGICTYWVVTIPAAALPD